MNQVYSVETLNRYIKSKFVDDPNLSYVKVKGELSNVKYHSSGHIYFTLKDSKSAIAGVMFASSRTYGLKFVLKEGQSVVVSGEINVYERDGKYQIYASSFSLDGEGALYEKYEQLKKQLEEEGLFDKQYKREIPKYISTLGVVTASTGAAVQDIINVSKRRFPYIKIYLYPAKVQGDGAAESVCEGIRVLNELGVDTIIVGRGGGSIEDLWAFNEEIVARAIFNSYVPVISAVGHETDFTIADFVSDLRAPTPSAAAELAVFDYSLFVQTIIQKQNRLNSLISRRINDSRNRLEYIIRQIRAQSPVAKINEQRIRLDHSSDRLNTAMQYKLTAAKHQRDVLIERLRGLDPILKLSQGYSLAENSEGKVISSVELVKTGEKISVHVQDGDISASVLEIEKVKRNG